MKLGPLGDDSQLVTKGKSGKLIKLGAWCSCKCCNCFSNHTESQPRAPPGSPGSLPAGPSGKQLCCHAFPAVTTYSQTPSSLEAAVTSTCKSLLMRQAHESKNLTHYVLGKQHGWGRGGSKVWPFCPSGSGSFVSGRYEALFRPQEGTIVLKQQVFIKIRIVIKMPWVLGFFVFILLSLFIAAVNFNSSWSRAQYIKYSQKKG